MPVRRVRLWRTSSTSRRRRGPILVGKRFVLDVKATNPSNYNMAITEADAVLTYSIELHQSRLDGAAAEPAVRNWETAGCRSAVRG